MVVGWVVDRADGEVVDGVVGEVVDRVVDSVVGGWLVLVRDGWRRCWEPADSVDRALMARRAP
jgi:hypothetical protein